MTKRIGISILLVAACGGAKPSSQATTPTASGGAPFELGEITVLSGNDATMKIHADGTSEVATYPRPKEPAVWEHSITFQTDGTVAYRGKPMARLNPDGSVTNVYTQKAMNLEVTAERFAIHREGDLPAAEMALAADGALKATEDGKEHTEDMKGRPSPHVTGADTPGKRRAVLMMMGLMIEGFAHPEQFPSENPGSGGAT
jgi:hypothetical protein